MSTKSTTNASKSGVRSENPERVAGISPPPRTSQNYPPLASTSSEARTSERRTSERRSSEHRTSSSSRKSAAHKRTSEHRTSSKRVSNVSPSQARFIVASSNIPTFELGYTPALTEIMSEQRLVEQNATTSIITSHLENAKIISITPEKANVVGVQPIRPKNPYQAFKHAVDTAVKSQSIDEKIYRSLHDKFKFPIEYDSNGYASPATEIKNGRKLPMWSLGDKDKHNDLITVKFLNFHAVSKYINSGCAVDLPEDGSNPLQGVDLYRGAIYSYLKDIASAPRAVAPNMIWENNHYVDVEMVYLPKPVVYKELSFSNIGDCPVEAFEYPVEGTILKVFKYKRTVMITTSTYLDPKYCTHLLTPNYKALFWKYSGLNEDLLFDDVNFSNVVHIFKLVHPATGQISNIPIKKMVQYVGAERLLISGQGVSSENVLQNNIDSGVVSWTNIDYTSIVGEGELFGIYKIDDIPSTRVAALKNISNPALEKAKEYRDILMKYNFTPRLSPGYQTLVDAGFSIELANKITAATGPIERYENLYTSLQHGNYNLSNSLFLVGKLNGTYVKFVKDSYSNKTLMRGSKQNPLSAMVDYMFFSKLDNSPESQSIHYYQTELGFVPYRKYQCLYKNKIPLFESTSFLIRVNPTSQQQQQIGVAGFTINGEPIIYAEDSLRTFGSYVSAAININNFSRKDAIYTYAQLLKNSLDKIFNLLLNDNSSTTQLNPAPDVRFSTYSTDSGDTYYEVRYNNLALSKVPLIKIPNNLIDTLYGKRLYPEDTTLRDAEAYFIPETASYNKEHPHGNAKPLNSSTPLYNKLILRHSDVVSLSNAFKRYIEHYDAFHNYVTDNRSTFSYQIPDGYGGSITMEQGPALTNTRAALVADFISSLYPRNEYLNDSMSENTIKLYESIKNLIGFYTGISIY